jgi:hypothetical protein
MRPFGPPRRPTTRAEASGGGGPPGAPPPPRGPPAGPPPPLEVARVIERAALRLGEGLDACLRDVEHGPLDKSGEGQRVAVFPLQLELGPLGEVPAGDLRDLHGDLDGAIVRARQVEDRDARRDGLVEQRAQRGVADDGQPSAPDDKTGNGQQSREKGETGEREPPANGRLIGPVGGGLGHGETVH